MKKILLLFGMLALSLLGFGQPQPVKDLGVSVQNNDAVLLTWSLPEAYSDTNVLSHSGDSLANCLYYGINTLHAHHFDVIDLQDYVGWRVESISSLNVVSLHWNLYAAIWKCHSEDSIARIYEQGFYENIPQNEWYSIFLDEPLFIEPNTQYRFGVRTEYPLNNGERFWSIPLDGKPAVSGKGNLIGDRVNDSDNWMYWEDGGNVIIKTVLCSPEGEKAILGVLGSDLPTCYRIYRNGELIKQTHSPFQCQYSDTEFSRETDVEYCVTAVYGDEESEAVCATATITCVGETEADDGITVSPNPTHSLVRIEGATVAEVQVYNALGQLVKTVQNSNEIDMSHLPEGVCLLRITATDGSLHTRKVTLSK